MRRSRRILALATVLVLVLFVGIALCEAEEVIVYEPPLDPASVDFIEWKVQEANEKIWETVYQAEKKAEGADDAEIDEIITWLEGKIENIADRTIDFAERHGATVECEPEPYYIGDHEVLVDPMKVAGL
ncbi:MAG TPA: hypothetical protein GX721_10430 [Firmicutes bacterium]|jgi:hypothetical protein|nr:hypothetical protein [Bacillota bacterium]